jgi:putative hydrolase of the HAD superfamily
MDHSIKAVIFDLDDTLFDHRHSVQAGLRMLQQTNQNLQQWPLEDLTNTYTNLIDSLHPQVLQGLVTQEQARIQRMQGLFSRYNQPLSVDEARSSADRYRKAYRAARQPVAGVMALLEYLRPRVKIGVITNNTSREQHEKLDMCGLTLWIDVVVISEEVGFIKPDPAIFKIALEQLGCGPEQAVMVGDSWKVDVLGARGAGIRPVWFNRFGLPNPEEAMMIDTLEPAESIAALLLKL